MNEKVYKELKAELYNKFGKLPDYRTGRSDLGKKFKSETHYLNFIIEASEDGNDYDIRRKLTNKLEDFVEADYILKCKDKTKIVSSIYKQIRDKNVHVFVRKIQDSVPVNDMGINISTDSICAVSDVQKVLSRFGEFMPDFATDSLRKSMKKIPKPWIVPITSQDHKKFFKSSNNSDFANLERKATCDVISLFLEMAKKQISSKDPAALFMKILLECEKIDDKSPHDMILLGEKIDHKILGISAYHNIVSSFKREIPLDNTFEITDHYAFGHFFADIKDGLEDAMVCQTPFGESSTEIKYCFALTKDCIKYDDTSTTVVNLLSVEDYVKSLVEKNKNKI